MRLFKHNPFPGTLRTKLSASLISVVLITGFFSTAIGIKIINDNIIGQAYDSVQSNLTTAQFLYDEQINLIRMNTDHIASNPLVLEVLEGADPGTALPFLRSSMEKADLDILNIVDSSGRVVLRARTPDRSGDSLSGDLFIRRALSGNTSVWGSDCIPGEVLAREGRDLAQQAFIKRIPTPRALKRTKSTEERALALKAATPIIDGGRLLGVVCGARILNKNYELVDRIKNLVFKDEKYNGYDYGTTTIFLDDVRISTNVKDRDGSRAIGTCVSEEVYNEVVGLGNIWLDKAFVVHDWYISAYKPIYSIDGNVLGILYVGILEEKFDQIKRNAIFSFSTVIVLTLVVAGVFAGLLIQNILQPVKKLSEFAKEIGKGNYDNKIAVDSADELGELCAVFNKMADAIVERDERLKEKTQQQTMQLQKLASLGRLASGIAHEINNPLTGVLTFSSELLEELKETEYSEDLQTIIDETIRCRKIVKSVLDFARETKLEKQQADINGVIDTALSILENHFAFQSIRIVKQYAPDLPSIEIDVNQIRSVITNLCVNAADAMPEGGQLSVITDYDSEPGTVSLVFADTGQGIPPENIPKLFEPFFTTKDPGKGTGLGLAISYGIIKRHNGDITVDSVPGKGTTFTVKLPVQ